MSAPVLMETARRFRNGLIERPYASLAVLCLLICPFFDRINPNDAAALMAGGLLVLCVSAVCLHARGRLTHRRLILLLVAAGVLLRIGYALYTPYGVRQHDAGIFGGEGGHAGYIGYIADHLALPHTNAPWQFYHPPLHHTVSGLWLWLNLSAGVPAEAAYENIQLLTAFYSCAAILICYGVFRELKLSRRATAFALAIVCFHPTFIILAGSINNDMLWVLFYLAALLFAIRWYREPSMKNVLCLAVCTGLAMMAKLSAVTIAPVIAFVFLVKLWKERKRAKKLFGRIGAFCLVSVPLGVWYPVRNLLLFQQPLSYVPELGKTFQYVGNYGIADRLWNIPWSQLGVPYQSLETGYNIPLSLMKTATFGESEMTVGAPANILLYVHILLAVVALFAMVRMLIRKDGEKAVLNRALGLAWIVLMASYVIFCLDFPSVCSEDFRYVVPTLLIGTVFFAQLLDGLRNGSKWKKGCARAIECAVLLFCVFSAVVYVALGVAG